jgi:NAD(P)-dependent dehydrogenase (short-subunit alcohol dehydrogenase family)
VAPAALLEGRRTLITGAATGIGRAIAERFAEEGASLIVADLDSERVETVAEELRSAGHRAKAVATDVSVEAQAASASAAAVEEYGGLDVLVSNAGVGVYGDALGTDVATWDRAFAVNVKGGFLCARAAIPAIRDSGGGVILFTASEHGISPTPGTVAYSAGKAAVVNMTRAMALDHGRDGIRVNCVCPGGTRTEQAMRTMERFGLSEDAHGRTVPYGARLAEPVEIANAFVFLASDLAGFVSGQAVVVDGGHSAGYFMGG